MGCLKQWFVCGHMNEWVSVAQGFPEECVEVLTYSNDKEMKVDYVIYFDDDPPTKIWARVRAVEQDQVTHWRFLPEAPK